MRTKRHVKIFLLIAVIIVAVYISKKNAYHPFIEQVSKTNNELIDYNGQSVTVDDYTVTLEKTLFDENTGLGYLAFAITKKDGKPKVEINRWHQVVNKCFGKNNQFRISVDASTSETWKYKGKTLYEYIFFETDNVEHLEIRLSDNSAYDENTKQYKEYPFTIKGSVDSKEFDLGKGQTLTLSPLGILIESDKNIREISITLVYQDGNEENVFDTEKEIGIASSGSHVTDWRDFKYTFVFDKLRDIDDVESVRVN